MSKKAKLSKKLKTLSTVVGAVSLAVIAFSSSSDAFSPTSINLEIENQLHDR